MTELEHAGGDDERIPCEDRGDDGTCALGWYGGRPSPGVCRQCLAGGKRGEGLGDTVARVIHRATGGRVRPCRGCDKRRERLNRLRPKK